MLHRMAPGVKLPVLLGVSSAPFIAGPLALGPCAGLIILGSLLAGVRPWELLRGARPLAVLILVIMGCRSITFYPIGFNRAGCLAAAAFGGNMLASFAAGALLFSVTTMRELKDFLNAGEKALARPLLGILRRVPGTWKRALVSRLETPRLGLGISLMLAFLPRFFEVWETARCAYQARGGKKGVPALLVLIPLVTGNMIHAADETATALISRGLR